MRAPLLVLLLSVGANAQPRYFRIEVVERDAGTPIAGARLETTGRIVYTSDRNGLVAFYEPGLMNQPVHFLVSRSGYEHPADFFDYRGRSFDTVEGGTGRLELVPSSFDAGAVPVVDDAESRKLADGGVVPTGSKLFALRIVDGRTDAGVPLVFVEAPGRKRVTDSSGLIAWEDPDGKPAALVLHSHGYLPLLALVTPTPGGSAQLAIDRLNIAERAYRVTGGGIYRDTVLLGLPASLAQPVLSGKVIGQDSVQSAIYRGKPFFVWGDTTRPAYPLGNFASSAARGRGLDASGGVDLDYFVDAEGFSKKMAPMGPPGLVWLAGLVNVTAEDGGEALFAPYGIFPGLAAPTEAGLVRFDDATEEFVKVLQVDAGPRPDGHALRWNDFVLFDNGVKIPARASAMTAPETWQVLPRLELAGNTALDFETGASISLHENDTIEWNPHRGRFIRFASQIGGTSSFLGELYYLEADTPRGPWSWARKVVSHDDYTLYNPRHHRFFDEAGGRRVYVEGTYTTSFSGSAEATPRYDYNQVMYRVDLDDPRLVLPVPLYELDSDAGRTLVLRDRLQPDQRPHARPVLMALDRAAPGAVPVFRQSVCAGSYSLEQPGHTGAAIAPAFWAMPIRPILPGGARIALGDGRSEVQGWRLPRTDYAVEEWLPPVGISAPEVCVPLGEALSITASAWGLTAPVTYRWSTPAGELEGQTISARLAIGLHALSVSATDATGRVVTTRTLAEVAGPPQPVSPCRCSTGGAGFALLVLLGLGWRAGRAIGSPRGGGHRDQRGPTRLRSWSRDGRPAPRSRVARRNPATLNTATGAPTVGTPRVGQPG